MIGRLSGIVLERNSADGAVLLDVHGVGYEVSVSLQTLAHVPEVGQPCELWIFTHVREDALLLFGFATPGERALFRLLLQVPKVGPKLAMSTMGGLPAAELANCLAGGDVDRLFRIPGIGKKTAEQMTLTLRDKVAQISELFVESPNTAIEAPSQPSSSAIVADAQAMLVALGWKQKPVEQVMAELAKNDDPETLGLDGLVRSALTRLMEN